MKVLPALLISLLSVGSTFAQEDRPFVVIHRQGEHDCHMFRIPGIAITNDATLLAVYDMRYRSRRDLQGHMDIGLSRSTDGGKTWEEPRPIMDMGEFGGLPEDQNGCSDSNILVDRKTGEIFVSAVWTHGKPGTHQWSGKGSEPGLKLSQSSQFMIVRSKDDGKTWSVYPSDHKSLPEPVCMASLISHKLKDGRTDLFFSNPHHKSKRQNMTVQMSLDDGKTWSKRIVLDKDGGAYSSFVMVNHQTVGILYESSRADLVFQTIGLEEFGL